MFSPTLAHPLSKSASIEPDEPLSDGTGSDVEGLPLLDHVGVVLVGGRSERFGAPKALARLGERTLLERVLRAHRRVFRETVMAGRERDLDGYSGTPLIFDRVGRSGPLGGLHSGLCWALDRGLPGVFVTGCDAPFLEPSLIRSVVAASQSFDAVVPISPDGRAQPLLAWYGRGAMSAIEANLAQGAFSLVGLISQLDSVNLLHASSITLRRPAEHVFLNVNSPDDLARAQRYLEEFPDDEGGLG